MLVIDQTLAVPPIYFAPLSHLVYTLTHTMHTTCITHAQVARLVRGATSVRALVRVKIADDNDLNTAREALATMAGFFKRVSEEAARRGGGCTAFDVLQERRTQSPAAFLKPLPSASTTAAAAASAAAAAAIHRSAGAMARPRIRVTGAAAAAGASSNSGSSNGNSGSSGSSAAATNGAHSHHVSKQSTAADSTSTNSSISSTVVGASLEQLKRRRMPAADDSRPSAYVS
jgi:hypothetical protein